MSKTGLVLAGLALVLAIAVVVAGRVKFGTFLPGILVVAAIAIIGAVLMLRSHQSVARKAIVVTAIVLVVAVAIPASWKVVFPAYNHFFPQKSAQASRAGTGTSGPGSETEAGPGTGAGPGSGTGGPASGTAAPKSGILVMSGDGWDKADFGYIDPTSGKYTHVSSFALKEPGDPDALEISPDLTKYATIKSERDPKNPSASSGRAGWMDTSGKFTAVSPAPAPAADFPASLPPSYSSPVFDGAGNFYYWSRQNSTDHLYKLPAGATSNPQEITPTPKYQGGSPLRNFDGTLNFGCGSIPGKWLGADTRVTVAPDIGFPTSPTTPSSAWVIAKFPLIPMSDGCKTISRDNQDGTKIFDIGIQTVDQPVASPDGTKLAFYNGNSPGGLYVLNLQGDGKPTKIADKGDLKFGNLKLIRWN